MKIRKGFVSNSSSTSFVIVGINLEGIEFDNEKIIDEMGDIKLEVIDQGDGDGATHIGARIATTYDNDGTIYENLSGEGLKNLITDTQKKINKHLKSKNIEGREVKIFSGMEYTG